MMKEYHKIKTLFQRDNKTKKLIEGAYADETYEMLKDLPWRFTEKVDGTNIRILWDGHKVSFGGRTENAQIPAHLMNRLLEIFGGEATAQLFEQKFGEMEVELFGEGYGAKIQKGGGTYIKDGVDFILFDVMVNDNFLTRESVEDIAAYFGIKAVPEIFIGTLAEGIAYVKGNPDSVVATNGAKMEGLVARPLYELKDRMGRRIIAKIKFHDFD